MSKEQRLPTHAVVDQIIRKLKEYSSTRTLLIRAVRQSCADEDQSHLDIQTPKLTAEMNNILQSLQGIKDHLC